MDKINDKCMEKIKYYIQEIKNNDKSNNNNEKFIDKTICKNTSSLGNYIYSKRCMLARKHIQFTNPIPSSNSVQKRSKNIGDSFNNNKMTMGGEGDGLNKVFESRAVSQLNIFPKNSKNDNNQIISERLLNKNKKDILFNEKEERKNVTINHKDINFSRRSLQRVIPTGVTKKIKVNKNINLNA